MIRSCQEKILTLSAMIERVAELKSAGKKVVQSHGVFDMIHPGIARHLAAARQLGDVLIVTVIRDQDVHRGPGRPVFTEQLRGETVAAVEHVDYVCSVDDETPFSCVKQIQPTIFVKGQAYDVRDRDLQEKVFQKERELYLGKCLIMETEGLDFHDAHTVEKLLDSYPPATRPFLEGFKREHSYDGIAEAIDALADMKVLVVGDGIIDEYHYCRQMGKSSKANLVVSQYLAHEVFAGGAFVVANHVAGLCHNVELVSLLGDSDRREDFARKELKGNVQPTFFTKSDSPTIVKKRYLDDYKKQKIHEVCYINDDPISGQVEQEIIHYLQEQIPKYDMVMISDFGHGFITPGIMEVVGRRASHWAANAQANAANRGYNLITKYSKPDYVCLDEPELRLAAQAKYDPIESVLSRVAREIQARQMIVTVGKHGCVGVGADGAPIRTPVFSTRVVDTVGAGDAFFACTAPCSARNMSIDMLAFIGNVAGAIAVQVVCNKEPIERFQLLELAKALLE